MIKRMRPSNSYMLFIGGGMLAVLVAVTLFAPVIAPYSASEQDLRQRFAKPSSQHLLGTDNFGRDVLSRVLIGTRSSMAVGVGGLIIGCVGGLTLGAIAGFRQGSWLDRLLLQVVDVLMSFPTMVLGIMVVALLGPGLAKTIMAVGVAFVARFFRLARGEILIVRNYTYVEAAKAIGASDGRIILRHILPNIVAPFLVMFVLWLASAVVVESSLSFLGLGVQPPFASWGVIIKDGMEYLTIRPMLVLAPSMMIALTVYGFILVGDGLQEILDPKLTKKD